MTDLPRKPRRSIGPVFNTVRSPAGVSAQAETSQLSPVRRERLRRAGFDPQTLKGLNALGQGAQIAAARDEARAKPPGPTMAELVGRIESLEVQLREAKSLLPEIFVAKNHGDGTWDEAVVAPSAATLETTSTRKCDSSSHYSKLLTLSELDSDGVLVLQVRYPTGHRYVLVGGGSADLRLVSVSQTGGSAGDASTPCSYTYTVFDYDSGDTLDTAVALTGNGQRTLNASMNPGTVGMARVRGDSVILIWVDETFDQATCAEAPLEGGF